VNALLALLLAFAAQANTVADAGLAKLHEGNRRYSEGHLQHPDQEPTRRHEVARAQHPFAVIVSCSDSRVPPEIVFDQGIGDLFVIREAGNIIDDVTIASIEYAVEHLDVHLVVVLGHKSCGAIAAAIEGDRHAHLHSIVDAIKPALTRARGKAGDFADNICRANVEVGVNTLTASRPVLAERVRQGKLKIVGAYYDLDSGRVTFLNNIR
jgi:carbonic anhydrase